MGPLVGQQKGAQKQHRRDDEREHFEPGGEGQQYFDNDEGGDRRNASQKYLKFSDQAIWLSLSVG
jgi:hypothetical protein